jgi:hypothetical protein
MFVTLILCYKTGELVSGKFWVFSFTRWTEPFCCIEILLNMYTFQAGRSGDRIPVGERFSAPIHTGDEDHPVSYAVGTGSLFPGLKRPGRGVNHPHPLWVFRAWSRANFTFTFHMFLLAVFTVQMSHTAWLCIACELMTFLLSTGNQY